MLLSHHNTCCRDLLMSHRYKRCRDLLMFHRDTHCRDLLMSHRYTRCRDLLISHRYTRFWDLLMSHRDTCCRDLLMSHRDTRCRDLLISYLALRITHSPLTITGRIKPRSGDWVVMINFLQVAAITSLSSGSNIRNGYEYTDTFGSSALIGVLTPHVARLLRHDVKSCILDGEMMGWNTRLKCYKMKGINFDVKSLKLGDVHQPCFCVFDVLYLNGQVLTNKPLRDRMRALQGMFTPEEGILAYTDRLEITTGPQVMEELNAAIDRRLEGIVLKDPGSVYKPNTRKGGWYKIKPEYTEGMMDHLDLIIMGGYYGDGRRRGIISHFLVGVAVPPTVEGTEPSEFHSLGRVGSGYTMDELAELLQKLSPHWQRVRIGYNPPGLVWTKEKPDVWIAPHNSHIVEIKATEIVESRSFKMNHTLRFPRVEKIRYDKNWSECLTTIEFENLRKEASGKLYSRHVKPEDDSDGSPKKKRQMKELPTLASQFRGADLSGISQTSALLSNKEFCVFTSWKTLTKQEIETKIVENGGTVVQNPGPDTFCVLASECTLRVRNIAKVGHYDVARLDWLMAAMEQGVRVLPLWTPADLLSISPQTSEALATQFDKYGDSYTQPATLESLKYSLAQVEKLGDAVQLTPEDLADFDIELFSGPSPYGMFRLCYAYFDKYEKIHDPTSKEISNLYLSELDFCFYGGKSTAFIEEQTTHVVVHSKFLQHLAEIQAINHQRPHKFHLVTDVWVEESVKTRTRQDERSLVVGLK
uniref:DNA ligase 4 n=2 Tax=Timema TaxID=61471 RepID=A0A7R9D947_TIMCR|nr:unnamed protein product [Timema cristinae]